MSPHRNRDHPENYIGRAQLIDLQMSRVHEQARQAARRGDLKRMDELEAESVVLLDSMRSLREEQIIDGMRPPPKRKKPWWRFW